MMITVGYILVLGLVSFVVSTMVLQWTRTYVVHVIASATAVAVLLQLAGFVYYGRVDEWAYIAFPVTWVIGAGCATLHVIVRRARSILRQRSEK
jgi:glycerol-3-phosphate acyltransferase PlsY